MAAGTNGWFELAGFFAFLLQMTVLSTVEDTALLPQAQYRESVPELRECQDTGLY